MDNAERMLAARDYHDRTKHHPRAYANSLGYMDWPNQPNPFRSFDGTQTLPLSHPTLQESPRFDDLYDTSAEPSPVSADSIARFFYHSLALSAWKQAGFGEPWSLRINPSSGALHPTEGYLICGPVAELTETPGLFHYQPYQHYLERRAEITQEDWGALVDDLPEGTMLIGLTSIYWRESWKYGERAFRYCNHDVGHAIACLAYAAQLLGWSVKRMTSVTDDDLNRLLGTDKQSGIEAEHGDCLLALSPSGTPVNEPAGWSKRIPDMTVVGTPNTLSKEHHPWPIIDEVSKVTRQDAPETVPDDVAGSRCTDDFPPRPIAAEQIIRQRRSARDMDGKTKLSRDEFYHMLGRTLPGEFPFDGLNISPAVSLAVFVNRVEGLIPGLYILVRAPEHESSLRQELSDDYDWQLAEGAPDGLPLYRLGAGDMKQAAKVISCNQDIAGDGAFALGMLARFDDTLNTQGAAVYPRLFWETGVIGQVLYLEAEAAGVSGTGIGCFFDDLMHDLLGIQNHSWQSLYHFTVGGALDDERLKTIPPYYHLPQDD